MIIDDRNSMLNWYPKIKDLAIMQPETNIVPIQWMPAHQGIRNFPQVYKAARQIGFPLFMRTDHFSGKHSWNRTCYVDKLHNLEANLLNLVEESEMAGMLGLPVNAIVFRKYVEMESAFIAFGGLPVSKERRYFVKDGRVKCHHAYWIEPAIEFWGATRAEEPPDWREKLQALNYESDVEIDLLTTYAQQVSQVLSGYWSVDFCLSKSKMWYLIDCATGEQSWHPPCQYAKEL